LIFFGACGHVITEILWSKDVGVLKPSSSSSSFFFLSFSSSSSSSSSSDDHDDDDGVFEHTSI
jgi:hypothetical protein